MAAKIVGFENDRRISTQKLLQKIYAALDAGRNRISRCSLPVSTISAGRSGPRMAGPLRFRVKNPGQRVGSFGLEGTEIIVEGSAPADAGWLNAGASLVIKGDGGDTTAHCSAAGKIYVAGRVGTRSGSLMKHDPAYEPPEFWILKNTGSFSFEFMGGGIAVVCGYDSDEFESVLGDRSCVGMVGGTILCSRSGTRASPIMSGWPAWMTRTSEFLQENLPIFLKKIDKEKNFSIPLTDWSQWQKIVAKTYEERKAQSRITLHEFIWRKNGFRAVFFRGRCRR